MGWFPWNKALYIHTHLTNRLGRMKEITLRVPDTMVRLIEEWAEHIPEMEVVSLKESGEYELDEMNRRMTLAMRMLEEDGTLRYGYDYTWIMVGIGDGAVKGLGGFRSPQSFMDYLRALGVERVPSRTTLSTWFGRLLGTYPDWTFTDTQDPQENLRRKNVVRQLVSALNRAAKQEG